MTSTGAVSEIFAVFPGFPTVNPPMEVETLKPEIGYVIALVKLADLGRSSNFPVPLKTELAEEGISLSKIRFPSLIVVEPV